MKQRRTMKVPALTVNLVRNYRNHFQTIPLATHIQDTTVPIPIRITQDRYR